MEGPRIDVPSQTGGTLQELKAAVRTGGHSAKAVFGRPAGLREFGMEIRADPPLRMELASDQSAFCGRG